MAQRIVFSDASPLIGLSLVDGLGWLESLFGVICITDVVADELLPGSNKPGEAEITAAIAAGSIRIVEDVWSEPAFPTLDEGEASTLRAAVNQEEPCLVIIDETAGRAVASELGLTVTGVVGVIIVARRRDNTFGTPPDRKSNGTFETISRSLSGLSFNYLISIELIFPVIFKKRLESVCY